MLANTNLYNYETKKAILANRSIGLEFHFTLLSTYNDKPSPNSHTHTHKKREKLNAKFNKQLNSNPYRK